MPVVLLLLPTPRSVIVTARRYRQRSKLHSMRPKKRKAKVNNPQSMPATGPKRKTNSKTIYPSVSDDSSTSDEDSAQPLKKKRHTAPGPKHNVSKSVLNLKADGLQIVDNDIEDAGDGDGEQGEEDADVSGGEEDVTVDVMDDDNTLLGEYELKNITES